MTQLQLYTVDNLSSTIFCCLYVCQALVSPNQIFTFSNIYRHTSPLLTLHHLIPSSTNLYWPTTSQYRHILTQYYQVPLMIHYRVRHSSANWIIFLFTTHLMSLAHFTWSSFLTFDFCCIVDCESHLHTSIVWNILVFLLSSCWTTLLSVLDKNLVSAFANLTSLEICRQNPLDVLQLPDTRAKLEYLNILWEKYPNADEKA